MNELTMIFEKLDIDILLLIIVIIFHLSISYLIGAINEEYIKIIKSIRK